MDSNSLGIRVSARTYFLHKWWKPRSRISGSRVYEADRFHENFINPVSTNKQGFIWLSGHRSKASDKAAKAGSGQARCAQNANPSLRHRSQHSCSHRHHCHSSPCSRDSEESNKCISVWAMVCTCFYASRSSSQNGLTALFAITVD